MSLGKQYMERINDGRKVWLGNQAVGNVAHHPAFAATVHNIALLLDKQNEPDTRDQLTYRGDKSRANIAFLVPRSKEDLLRRHSALKFYADATFGMMDGLSQYARSLLTGHYANRHYSGIGHAYANKIESYYKFIKENDLLCTGAAHDPLRNDSQPPSRFDEASDPGLRIVRETEDGIIVSGARMAAANAPYVDEILVSFYDPRSREDKRHGYMFAVAANTPGVNIVCRESFVADEPDDHPVSARFEDMDTVIIFDDVLVPWERVFIKNNPEALLKIQRDPAAAALGQHQTVVRLLSNLEFIAAVGHALTSASDRKAFLHVQEIMGELIIQVETIKGLLIAAEHRSSPGNDNIWLPEELPLQMARNLGTRFYPRAIEILRQIGGDALLQSPAKLADFDGPIGHLLRQYYQGTDRSAIERTKLIKLAWDLVGSPPAVRRVLYEQFFWGDPVQAYANQYKDYPKKTLTDPVWNLVDTHSKQYKGPS
ncbi:4-hydroxyphenylacetate 3-hydroxylase N-terminal domain-containing protein [Paenibacillus naphthalenovorans]|uniref:4-hydroxyphenylacetate 3-hydroxylase n=1 Tax=Paenibacillus naphthalenovorans TaxID=162209 RepID=A0A0U2W908_9BACL|nr:4-hydroxyphenylacetate 3-hydroxylase N-terminal domain-containing protein [Paenibacillus naphthalenovorans]ALS24996.1 4-hydroxyphenylacetate 3-hydroxylase [Paenibacillus naphthalenovorans]GCL74074.1 4-hydroxyphenylacetate 3-hydroxylase [Paenibacillus naphthalenovorans]